MRGWREVSRKREEGERGGRGTEEGERRACEACWEEGADRGGRVWPGQGGRVWELSGVAAAVGSVGLGFEVGSG